MEKKTYNAIVASLDEKWRPMLCSTSKIDKASDNCALCKVFADGSICDGCPVKEKTGENSCNNSPYEEWFKHQKRVHFHHKGNMHRVEGCERCITLVAKEVVFLESLLLDEKSEVDKFNVQALKDLIEGKIATRTGASKDGDNSFIDESVLIHKVSEEGIIYQSKHWMGVKSDTPATVGPKWLDDNWGLYTGPVTDGIQKLIKLLMSGEKKGQ